MKVNRRTFLQYASTSLLLLQGLPVVGCGGLVRKDLLAPDSKPPRVGGLTKAEMDVLYLASLAPSGHNTQPWTVRVVGPQHWVIGSSKARWLPATDPHNHGALLSMGAFIENLVTALNIHGFEADVQVTAKDWQDTEIAHIRFQKSKVDSFPVQRITTRRMLKIPYGRSEIRPADVNNLTGYSIDHAYYFSPETRQAAYINEGTLECNRIQDSRRDALEETANWIRWSDEEAREHMDGLTPASMSIHGLAGWVARNFFTRQSIFVERNREMYLELVEKLLENHGGWLVIAGKDSSAAALIESGRKFERIWLKARELNIGVQPFSQLLEEAPGATAGLAGITGEVHFIMRLGYVESYPEPVSLRRPVRDFVSIVSG